MVSLMLASSFSHGPVVRDLRSGLERKYRVTITRGEDDRYAYRLRVRVAETMAPKGQKAEIRLDVRITDYRADVGGRRVSARTVGGGSMAIEPTGLPSGLSIAGPQGPIWLPLLSFYLPSAEGAFVAPKVQVGGRLTMAGKGTLAKGGVSIDATLSREEKDVGKLTLGTTLDAQGWPQKAQGTLVSADGTYRFTLEKS